MRYLHTIEAEVVFRGNQVSEKRVRSLEKLRVE